MQISKLPKYFLKSSKPQQLWAPLSTCLELWKPMMILNARNVYKKTSKSFQMPISSVAVDGNHGGGDKVWKTNKTSRANCLLGSYKSQLKPLFDHRRSPWRFGRLWNCATLFNCSTTPAEIWKSHQKTEVITEVWKRTSDKDDAFSEANFLTFCKKMWKQTTKSTWTTSRGKSRRFYHGPPSPDHG